MIVVQISLQNVSSFDINFEVMSWLRQFLVVKFFIEFSMNNYAKAPSNINQDITGKSSSRFFCFQKTRETSSW